VSDFPHGDPLAALYPPGVEALRIAWEHLQVPGPPVAYRLTAQEQGHPDPRTRFARRTIQLLSSPARPQDGSETLALIDKASPHSRFDLMLSELSAVPKSSPSDVRAQTGRALWRTGYRFVQFCSDPKVAWEFGLDGGELHLALNCDPHTWDRESVQAAKQFHLHLLYWDEAALAPLADAQTLGATRDRRLIRQALDPLGFLGARVIADALVGLDLGIAGAALLPPDDSAALRGERPLGCLIRLPAWAVLQEPAFEDLVRRIHLALGQLAAVLLQTFTGALAPLPPWHRHPLLPLPEIRARIRNLPWSGESRLGLTLLAQRLRGLPDRTAERLARGEAARRMDLMTLNLPAYTLNLHVPRSGPHADRRGQDTAAAPLVHLIIQPRLFSGIGGAGLLTLGGVPSVRVLRGRGVFTDAQWHERARFQRRFARYNLERLDAEPGLESGPIRRFASAEQGWT
jgi:hypothetical protein